MDVDGREAPVEPGIVWYQTLCTAALANGKDWQICRDWPKSAHVVRAFNLPPLTSHTKRRVKIEMMRSKQIFYYLKPPQSTARKVSKQKKRRRARTSRLHGNRRMETPRQVPLPIIDCPRSSSSSSSSCRTTTTNNEDRQEPQ